jgi:hypothetical protein
MTGLCDIALAAASVDLFSQPVIGHPLQSLWPRSVDRSARKPTKRDLGHPLQPDSLRSTFVQCVTGSRRQTANARGLVSPT